MVHREDNIPGDYDLDAYAFDIPPELVAQAPSAERDASRLLVLDRAKGSLEHRVFRDIGQYLTDRDCLIINRTRVIPVRLFGKKLTGGKVEVLFLAPGCPDVSGAYAALVRPFLHEGTEIFFPEGVKARVTGKCDDGAALLTVSGGSLEDVLEEHGRMPLPPYIKRKSDAPSEQCGRDRERYQTVYAQEKGSIAAPTAGLHFTPALLRSLREKGVTIAEITLHVGWGTFKPITVRDVRQHTMLPETFHVEAKVREALIECRARGGRVIAVGTTSVRTLESSAGKEPDADGGVAGDTSIFICPGYSFRAIDAMITNFHFPHSSPLMMTAAFAGKERLLAAYREAIRQQYRFFSYGDAMLIL